MKKCTRAQNTEYSIDDSLLMYYNDVLLCYGISPEELKEAYIAEFEKNMTRWYSGK